MQAYSSGFAPIYNAKWGGYAIVLAPRIRAYYEGLPIGAANRTVLDVACGSGQFARHFLQNGYRVIAFDSSEAMLREAASNVAAYIPTGQVRLFQGDAADFTIDERVGLAVSTYDALNHLDDLAALRSCFRCVYDVVVDDGVFIFDLNTRAGLLGWNSSAIEDSPELMLISRGRFDEAARRADIHITGFVRTASGLYERFEEKAYNMLFDLGDVKKALEDAGWRDVYLASNIDLAVPLAEPEQERRVFFIAHKPAPQTG
ncbi:MAG: class I SAM-dependent methyltransferase [Chloroflexi bacterium]|nr:class I SAM-dependent methyltransferase [Chloroflexota bacterium]MCL5273281.1 class I SAM-dependent methyltransferase [Chloroflexota bacterium]